MHDWQLAAAVAAASVLFNNSRGGDLMHALHMPSIKCDAILSQGKQRAGYVKAAVCRERLSHRRFGSALVAENGIRSA